jgi:hypothetical protein
MLNVSNAAPAVNGQRWNTVLPQFLHDTIMSTGLWDGIFYDNVLNDISWLNGGDIDLDRNGVRDAASTADSLWREGMSTLLARSRQLEGNDKIIIGNGNGQYYPTMNGRLIEEFPSNLDGGWSGAMKTYMDVLARGVNPALVIVNRIGTSTDYQSMRFGLASTLLGGGFFSLDRGSVQHAATWQFDEYLTDLGLPLGSARRLDGPTTSNYSNGIWRRDFERGVVLVNSTTTTSVVQLGEGLEQLHGSQSSVNGGAIVSSVTLAGNDGRLLLKRNITLNDTPFINGSVVQEFSADGAKVRQGYFTYAAGQPGGSNILIHDLDHDGTRETISATRGRVTVTNFHGTTQATFRPFGAGYVGDLSITTAQLQTTGPRVLLVAQRSGKNQRVRVYSMNGVLQFSFKPFSVDVSGGLFVAAGDVNRDGRDELMVSAGAGWKPLVRVYDQRGKSVSQFYAYGKGFRGGVRIAVGDLNNDGVAEIVTGAGPGGGPHVRIFNRRGVAVMNGFFPLPKTYRQGVYVSIGEGTPSGVQHVFISTPTIF